MDSAERVRAMFPLAHEAEDASVLDAAFDRFFGSAAPDFVFDPDPAGLEAGAKEGVQQTLRWFRSMAVNWQRFSYEPESIDTLDDGRVRTLLRVSGLPVGSVEPVRARWAWVWSFDGEGRLTRIQESFEV
jgi:ketosteroid isomerase-like protein